MQLKLETQVIDRHPEWQLGHRAIMNHLDMARAVTIDGVEHPLVDSHLPTVDPEHPSRLSAEELACME